MSAQLADPYTSRLEHEELADRADPVIWGNGEGPLDQPALRDFERRGFLACRPLGPGEVGPLRAEAQRLAREADAARDEVIHEPQGDTIRSIFRIHETSAPFRALCHDPRLVDLARQILGSDVYIHQSRVNYKAGFDGRAFQWHSDFETWHMEDGMPQMRAVSVSVALTDNAASNGPLMIIPGSHRRYVRCRGSTPDEHYKRSLRKQEYGVPSPQAIRQLADEAGDIHVCAGSAGSAVFFDCNAMHGSAGSMSPWPRTNLFLVFNSVENRLVQPFGGLAPRPDFLATRD